MKKYILFVYFGIIIFVYSQEKELPNYIGRVNDFGNFFTPKTIETLENALANHEKKTTNQIVILTVNTIGPYTIEEYGIRIAEKWKIGQKHKDNGVIIILSRNERKARIEVGYGLEGVLPDAKCKQIIEEAMIPYFKKGDFDTGILQGVEEILKILQDTESLDITKSLEEDKTSYQTSIEQANEDEVSKIIAEKEDVLMYFLIIYLNIGIISYIILIIEIFDKTKKFKSFVKMTLITFAIIILFWIIIKIYYVFQDENIQNALVDDINILTLVVILTFGILYVFMLIVNFSEDISSSSSSYSSRSYNNWGSSYSSSGSWSSSGGSFSGGGGSFGGGGASGSW